MPTPWFYPQNIVQYSEPEAELAHISWDDSDNFNALKSIDNRSVQSNGSLKHIARSPKKDLRNKTYFLRCTNFNFNNLPDSITGIEVKLTARRYGRAQDETIQLCLNDQLIGENQATLEINPEKIYGGETNLWDGDITRAMLNNNSFGFVLRFQAHRDWPHTDPVLIDAVEMRIW